jgi:glycosyltransferase involved in cell wall biosynthesis
MADGPQPVAPSSPAPEARGCSIVIPAFNTERYLDEAVESALAQTYRPLEVVLVDDGSTDGTPALVDRYRGRENVQTLHAENGGPARARNLGAHAARGAFLAFLDSDDVWQPTRIERCIARLDAEPGLAWVTADWYAIERGVVTQRRAYRGANALSFPADQLHGIARENFCTNGAVIRRSAFERAGGFDETIHGAEDYDLWIRLILAGGRVGLIDEPLGYYRLHDASLTARGLAQWESHLDALERNLPALVARGARPRSVDAVAVARRRAARGDTRGAVRFIRYAARDHDLSLARRAVLWLVAVRALAGRKI